MLNPAGDALFQTILAGEPHDALDRLYPFYPLTSVGMPPPGPNFVAAAQELDGSTPVVTSSGKGRMACVTQVSPALHYLYRRALYDEEFTLPIRVRGNRHLAPLVPGHLLYETTRGMLGGPRTAKVFVLGQCPGREEVSLRANFVGPTSQELFRAFQDLGVEASSLASWYFTNLIKWPQLDKQSDALPNAWIADCRVLLEQELRLVRPDFILCLGSKASQALLGPACSVKNMAGRVTPYVICLAETGEAGSAAPGYQTAKVMTALHPAAVFRRPEGYPEFKHQLGLFWQLTQGATIGGRELGVRHPAIYTLAELRRIVDAVRRDPRRWLIAVDAEWQGTYPQAPGAYLRTVQFSTREQEGYTVVLRYQGGQPAFRPSIEHGLQELRRLLVPDGDYQPRVGGWFFRADLPWLQEAGIDLPPQYACGETPRSGGWEASLAYHAVNEASSYGLEDVSVRLTTAPRYDEPLGRCVTAYCQAHGLNSKTLAGYGLVPEWILHPNVLPAGGYRPLTGTETRTDAYSYAGYDSDVTYRIAARLFETGGLLDRDGQGQDAWQPYWVAHRASLAFLEMETLGIRLDKQRVDELTELFLEVRARLLADFRRRIQWPEFKPGSYQQCCGLLYGDGYAAACKLLPDGGRLPVRPAGAVTLGLRPIKTTGKRSKMWDDVVELGLTDVYKPSTDKESLGILGHQDEVAMRLRDLKFISHVLTSALRVPVSGEDGDFLEDEEGYFVYDQGIVGSTRRDGRVHTHLSQHKETRRAASSRPPLQSLSNRREDDYRRILGYFTEDGEARGDYLDVLTSPRYRHPLRSILCAEAGWVLVSADIKVAEIATLAWNSQDAAMIEDVRRNMLPETHPDYLDIHAATAVEAFNLSCAPTKKALKAAGMAGRRVAAKNVRFGIPYGRQAEAIRRQCREEGVEISLRDTQRLIDFYFLKHPNAGIYLAACRDRVREPGWLATIFGGRRRFTTSRDEQVHAEQERQAQNFPIQGSVADGVSRMLDMLYHCRVEWLEIVYRLLLQNHDAVLFEVPVGCLQDFLAVVIPECMSRRVPFYPTDLDGTRLPGVGPYYFGIDTEVYLNWGEPLTAEEARRLNIDPTILV